MTSARTASARTASPRSASAPPTAARQTKASGRFVLRLDPALHEELRRDAAEAGQSLNEHCVHRLSAPLGPLSGLPELRRLKERATTILGEDLVGLVLYGSWARQEATPESDVDLLLVVEPQRPVDRELYRQWDRQAVSWQGRPVEPHFVQMPRSDGSLVGTWAEVAIDGLVLFERDLQVSELLRSIRAEVAAGRLVRHYVHGQPYWTRTDA